MIRINRFLQLRPKTRHSTMGIGEIPSSESRPRIRLLPGIIQKNFSKAPNGDVWVSWRAFSAPIMDKNAKCFKKTLPWLYWATSLCATIWKHRHWRSYHAWKGRELDQCTVATRKSKFQVCWLTLLQILWIKKKIHLAQEIFFWQQNGTFLLKASSRVGKYRKEDDLGELGYGKVHRWTHELNSLSSQDLKLWRATNYWVKAWDTAHTDKIHWPYCTKIRSMG